MLVTGVGDEMSWWQFQDVGDDFGHFGHQHPLSLNLSVGHQYLNSVANILTYLLRYPWNRLKHVSRWHKSVCQERYPWPKSFRRNKSFVTISVLYIDTIYAKRPKYIIFTSFVSRLYIRVHFDTILDVSTVSELNFDINFDSYRDV